MRSSWLYAMEPAWLSKHGQVQEHRETQTQAICISSGHHHMECSTVLRKKKGAAEREGEREKQNNNNQQQKRSCHAQSIALNHDQQTSLSRHIWFIDVFDMPFAYHFSFFAVMAEYVNIIRRNIQANKPNFGTREVCGVARTRYWRGEGLGQCLAPSNE